MGVYGIGAEVLITGNQCTGCISGIKYEAGTVGGSQSGAAYNGYGRGQIVSEKGLCTIDTSIAETVSIFERTAQIIGIPWRMAAQGTAIWMENGDDSNITWAADVERK